MIYTRSDVIGILLLQGGIFGRARRPGAPEEGGRVGVGKIQDADWGVNACVPAGPEFFSRPGRAGGGWMGRLGVED